MSATTPPYESMIPPNMLLTTSQLPSRARNACDKCMRGKRSCDRQLPGCARCAEKGTECQYSTKSVRRVRPTGPHRRLAFEGDIQISSLQPTITRSTPFLQTTPRDLPLSFGITPPLVEHGLHPFLTEFRDNPDTSGSFIGSDASFSLSQSLDSYQDADSQFDQINFIPSWALASDAAQPDVLETDDLPWFLGGKSWKIERGWHSTPRSVLQRFLNGIQSWLGDWVKHGHNTFIHVRLYRSGLPSCLQDAFSTLATYLGIAEGTESIVLQIVESRLNNLIYQQSTLSKMGSTVDATAQLARVQALFIYLVICLFNGCPRHRLLAERTFPLLSQWCRELLETTIQARMSFQETDSPALAANEQNHDLRIWRLWIIAESIRRTWLVTSSTVCVYMTLRDGWFDCTGANIFTARKGLWDATSATAWVQIMRASDPLFFHYIRSCEFMKKVQPSDVDDFTHQMLLIGGCEVQAFDDWKAKENLT